jgi:hypothetical protein
VRATVGMDAHDGLGAATAWEHLSMLSEAMHAGDTAYVGPGLYRDEVTVQHDGTVDARLTFIADPSGQRTGDPPGPVMVTGAEPIDETIFQRGDAPGVYVAALPGYRVWGVVEMDGPQRRFARADNTKEFLVDKVPELAVVARLRATFAYDEGSGELTLHTSDDRPPSAHEIEILRRGAGFLLVGRHYVTVTGFTFRHMQDAGISFFKGSGDGIASDNVSYGSRQGIRVYDAPNVLVYGNTLFRNENSGVYFAAQSTNSAALRNVSYENLKGLRWSSQSNNAVALDNWAFDNQERGLALENTNHVLLRRNTLVNNAVSQLLVLQSDYDADDDCFTNGVPGQLVADFWPFPLTDRFPTLAAYQATRHQDPGAREGPCGLAPAKIDVVRLHRESTRYLEAARRTLRGEPADVSAPSSRGWLDRLLGR